MFVWELALSPSLGEMPKDTLKAAHNLVGTMEKASSTMLQRALSFAEAALCGRSLPAYNGAGHLSIRNIPIGCEAEATEIYHGVAKLKGDPTNLEELIELTRQARTPFIVDFNGSLDVRQWRLFVENVRSDALLYVEQPCAASEPCSLSGIGFAVYADESCQAWPVEALHAQGFSGLVLKPIRYSFDTLGKTIGFAKTAKMQTILGRMVGDYVEEWHLGALNAAVSINIDNWHDTRELLSATSPPAWLSSEDSNPPWAEMAAYTCASYSHILTVPTLLE